LTLRGLPHYHLKVACLPIPHKRARINEQSAENFSASLSWPCIVGPCLSTPFSTRQGSAENYYQSEKPRAKLMQPPTPGFPSQDGSDWLICGANHRHLVWPSLSGGRQNGPAPSETPPAFVHPSVDYFTLLRAVFFRRGASLCHPWLFYGLLTFNFKRPSGAGSSTGVSANIVVLRVRACVFVSDHSFGIPLLMALWMKRANRPSSCGDGDGGGFTTRGLF